MYPYDDLGALYANTRIGEPLYRPAEFREFSPDIL
jgi:hypothetical protein